MSEPIVPPSTSTSTVGVASPFSVSVTATHGRHNQTVAEFVDLPLRSDRGDLSNHHPIGARPFGQWDRDLRVNGWGEREDNEKGRTEGDPGHRPFCRKGNVCASDRDGDGTGGQLPVSGRNDGVWNALILRRCSRRLGRG